MPPDAVETFAVGTECAPQFFNRHVYEPPDTAIHSRCRTRGGPTPYYSIEDLGHSLPRRCSLLRRAGGWARRYGTAGNEERRGKAA